MQRDADALLEKLWRQRVAANEQRREAEKRARRPRAVELDTDLPSFLRRQAI
jgi:hypothetical protein